MRGEEEEEDLAHANTRRLCDTNQSSSSKGQSGSTEVPSNLIAVISNGVNDELVRGSRGSNESTRWTPFAHGDAFERTLRQIKPPSSSKVTFW